MTDDDHEAAVRTRFLSEIAGHELKVEHASGLHRHLTCRRPGTSLYGFHVTTWPGYLCVSGDMGTFVFARLKDMFEFFRGDRVNASYWAEKLTAHDTHSGHLAFSSRLFEEALKSDFDGWSFDTDEDRERAWAELTDDWGGILGAETTEDARQAAGEWECEVSGQRFTDFWEHRLEEHSTQFLWCCHAIQWAITRFDEAQAPAPAEMEAA